MKLYSNIDNQAQTIPSNNLGQPGSSTFTLNHSNNPVNFPQQPQASNLNLESNNSLQLGLNALNLYMLPSHISVIDQKHQNQQFQRPLGSATRSTTPRKKIFNQENILYKIMEPVSEQIKQQISTKPVRFKSQIYQPQPPKDLTSYIQPREKTKAQQTSNQMPQKRLQQSMRRTINNFQPQTKQERQLAYRLLAAPILFEERQRKPQTMSQSMQPQINKNQIQGKIPEMLQRIDRNQKAITQLKNQVNQLIKLQNQKNLSLRKELSYRQKLIEQKQSNLQNQIRKLQSQQEFNFQRNRNQLKRQQEKRIHELAEENKMLSQKILEQGTKNSKVQQKQDSEYLRNRIAQLQLQRQAIQKDRIKNLRNLDISIIPHREQHFIPKVQLLIPTNQPPQTMGIRAPQPNSLTRLNQQNAGLPDFRYHHLGIREVKVTKIF